MRFYWNTNVYGWRMWGVTGNRGRWFIGYSKAPLLTGDTGRG